MSAWDVFKTNPFSLLTLTAAVNERPFKPSYLGSLGLFESAGINTPTLAIERIAGVLRLVSTSQRGGPGVQHTGEKRTMKDLRCAHIQVDDFINADEIFGVREFGTDSTLQTLRNVVNNRIGGISDNLDVTMENWYMGAIKGQVLDADGSTVLWNLFTEFGVTAYDPVDFTLGTDATPLKTICNGIHRKVMDVLGAAQYGGIIGLCGDDFFDKLHEHSEVKGNSNSFAEIERWANQAGPYSYIRFGGITFVNYRGGFSGGPSVATADCRFFPVGVPGLFIERFAPADYNETVNTLGLPRYAKVRVADNDKGIHVEVQTNPIVLCTRPKVLIRGTTSN